MLPVSRIVCACEKEYILRCRRWSSERAQVRAYWFSKPNLLCIYNTGGIPLPTTCLTDTALYRFGKPADETKSEVETEIKTITVVTANESAADFTSKVKRLPIHW